MKRIISVICLLILITAKISPQYKIIREPVKTAIHTPTGVINQHGETIVPFIYNDIFPFVNGIACASVLKEHDSKKSSDTGIFWGLIDKEGKEVIPFIYRSLAKCKNADRYIATDGEKRKGVIDSKGNIIIPFEHDYIAQLNGYTTLSNLLFFCRKNDEGYAAMNQDGEEVNPNRYTKIQPFSNYQRINYIVELNGKKGLLDYDGKQLIPCQYDKIKEHWWWAYQSPIPVAMGDKWGCVDSTGAMVIPCEYIKERGYSFSNKSFTMEDNDKRIVFDTKGRILLSTPKVIYGEYGDKAFFTRESYITKNHRKCSLAGLVTKEGENITPFMYERIYRLSDKYFLASLDDKTYGIIDHKGKTIQPFEYTFRSRQYDRNLVWLVKNGKAGLIDTDRKCKVVLDFEYDNTDHFDYTLSKNGKWGMFDRELNKISIPVVYDSISRSDWDHRKMYCVMKDHKWGIVDSLNNEVVPIEFDNISRIGHFSWWASTEINDKYGLIDNHYKIVLPCKYDDIRPLTPYVNWFHDNMKSYVAVRKGKLEGVIEIINSKAYDRLPFVYKSISYLGDNFFRIETKKGIGIADADNKIIVPCAAFSNFIYSEGVFIVKKK